eukprot:CAMPEP_0180416458 /NCGR_PEP_ID=MMETSP1036_2-20121128/496_1 /TAXON_ID=632150 /ORGANISM="Azadinium spinosum, Strain 3D9" /LENGTH=120 /DNA_ID=CAMNT_0022421393 /DNA_START=357 /DNA_END=716 /DNA_ORIENTATION=-
MSVLVEMFHLDAKSIAGERNFVLCEGLARLFAEILAEACLQLASGVALTLGMLLLTLHHAIIRLIGNASLRCTTMRIHMLANRALSALDAMALYLAEALPLGIGKSSGALPRGDRQPRPA